jgi:hypothetical protein
MQNRINIKGSITFEGWTSFVGFFIFFFGIYYVFYFRENSLLLSLFILIDLFGLILFISKKGVLIDLRNKQIKPYVHCLFFKLGKWQSSDAIDRIILEYLYGSNSNNYIHIPFAKGTKTETFTVSFKLISGKKIFIKEFPDYEKAKVFLDKYSELLQIEKKDCYERMLEEIAKLRETL